MRAAHDAEQAALAADYARVEAAILGRIGEDRPQVGLQRIEALMDLLGSPQRSFPTIHITGTNGKTSTARMIQTLLAEYGLRTGRFTSPHLRSMTERIDIDGAPISRRAFVRTYDDIAPFVAMVDASPVGPLSYFELLTGMAYAAFAEAPVAVGIVEVGIGGTWDSTNVIDADVAVVTPIGLDHTKLLGPTIADIARDKAGIIKPGATAVIAPQAPAAAAELLARAADVGAGVVQVGVDVALLHRELAVDGQLLTIRGRGAVYEDVFLPLHGAHQAANAVTAVAAVESFLGGGKAALSEEVLRAAFAKVTSPGRLEVVRRGPTVILDAAHNPHGASALVDAVAEAFAFDRLVVVMGVMADKDVEGILTVLDPIVDTLVATRNTQTRSMHADELGAVAEDVLGVDRVRVAGDLADAIDTAIALAERDGPMANAGVLVTGSVVTVGEARTLLGARRPAATPPMAVPVDYAALLGAGGADDAAAGDDPAASEEAVAAAAEAEVAAARARIDEGRDWR